MCGLIGSTGKPEARYLIALGCLAEKRGSDSAGVGWQVGDHLRIAKVAETPLVAFPVRLAPAIRHAAKYGGTVIGHTRAATTGKVTRQNAHPFLDKESRIAWAHNGVISNYQDFGDFEVDSQSLITGIKSKDFHAYHGAVALLWIENGKLHAFRKGNPLYRGIRKDAVYLASEQEMLSQIGCRKIKELSEGHLYVWNGMSLESVKPIPANEPWTRMPTVYTAGDGWEEYGGRTWDYEKKCFVYDACGRESGHRPAGFRSFRGDASASPTLAEEVMQEVLCQECHQAAKLPNREYCYQCLQEIIKSYGVGGRGGL